MNRFVLKERTWVIIALLLMSGAVDQLVATSTSVEERVTGDANFLLRALALPAYLFVGWVLLRFPGGTLRSISRAGWVSLLVAAAFVSVAWSIEPAATIPRAALVAMTTLFGLSLATRFSRAEFVSILATTCCLMVVIQLASVILLYGLAVHHDIHFPAVRGLFLHKNIAGRNIVMGFIAALALFSLGKRRSAMVAMCVCTLGVLVTLSTSALAVLLSMGTVFLLIGFVRKQRALGISLTVIISAFIALAVISGLAEQIAVAAIEGVGKDATLSTRTLIWERLISEVIPAKFMLGYGYNAFWSSPEGAMSVWNPRYFVPAHAHNGLLQTWVSFGLAGVIVLVAGYLKTLVVKLRLTLNRRGRDGGFELMFLVFFLITNFSEVSVLTYSGIIWVVFVFVCASKDEPINFETEGQPEHLESAPVRR